MSRDDFSRGRSYTTTNEEERRTARDLVFVPARSRFNLLASDKEFRNLSRLKIPSFRYESSNRGSMLFLPPVLFCHLFRHFDRPIQEFLFHRTHQTSDSGGRRLVPSTWVMAFRGEDYFALLAFHGSPLGYKMEAKMEYSSRYFRMRGLRRGVLDR